jgi:hypothetical protein
MECKFCGGDNVENYCSACGHKAISEFSVNSFLELQNHILENKDKYSSNVFKELIKSPLGEIGILSQQGLFKSFQLWGYLFRATEEKFGTMPDIADEDFIKIIKDKSVPISERLIQGTDYFDSKSNLISLDGLGEDKLIIPEIILVFNDYINMRISNIINKARNGELMGLIIRKDSADLESLREILFRNAVWGYLYKFVEGQTK